ncbi:MAG: class I SAM-dependent methyltransferase [Hyphomicrobiales bacterium]|nr:MAG: class I SAM-dependent methyltransferase [Hyphomicrobiales bacterium]
MAARLAAALAETAKGCLRVTFPSGYQAVIGSQATGVTADIAFSNFRPIPKIFWRGPLGFAESYLAGDFETDDLKAVFDYYMDNEPLFMARAPRLVRSSWADRLFHSRRANTRTGSRRNIAAHYDLGNDFYKLWLDADLNYSSGIYTHAGATLEAAQAEKYARILAALGLDADHDLLEIGCGWGGFAEAAARRCRSVTGLTISSEQFAVASARLQRAGLSERASIRFEDYRDVRGSFDRIASIEMIEAVGEENWSTYFRTLAERLKPGGVAVIQAITIREDLYDNYRRNPDFIQRYIFPGGMLPTVPFMRCHAQTAGLSFETVHAFGRCYERTLAEWRRRFEDAWPHIRSLGFDARFRRMWNYYLAYCEVGFARGCIDVGLYRMTKPTTA